MGFLLGGSSSVHARFLLAEVREAGLRVLAPLGPDHGGDQPMQSPDRSCTIVFREDGQFIWPAVERLIQQHPERQIGGTSGG